MGSLPFRAKVGMGVGWLRNPQTHPHPSPPLEGEGEKLAHRSDRVIVAATITD
jgi:hypothetical protein